MLLTTSALVFTFTYFFSLSFFGFKFFWRVIKGCDRCASQKDFFYLITCIYNPQSFGGTADFFVAIYFFGGKENDYYFEGQRTGKTD